MTSPALDGGGTPDAARVVDGGDGVVTGVDAGRSSAVPPCSRAFANANAEGFAIDREGNFILAGLSWSNDFGGGALAPGMFVATFDKGCAYASAATFAGAGNYELRDVNVDTDGNIYVVGDVGDRVAFGATVLTAADGRIFVAKLTPKGVPIFARAYGAVTAAYARSISVDASGAITVSGTYSGNADFGGGLLKPNGPGAFAGWGNVFVTKLDASGQHIWSRGIANLTLSNFEGSSRPVGVDADGNVLVGGQLSGDSQNLSQAVAPMFVAKYSALDGAPMWSTNAWPLGNLHGIAIDASGDAYVTGALQGGGDLGNSPNGVAGGPEAMFVAKLSRVDGATAWSHFYASNAPATSPFSTGIATDLDGHVVISGVAEDETFERSCGNSRHSFVVELDTTAGASARGWGFCGVIDSNLAVGPFGEICVQEVGWPVDLGSGLVSGTTVFASLP